MTQNDPVNILGQNFKMKRNKHDESSFIKASISAGVDLFSFIEVKVSGDFLSDEKSKVI